MKKNIEFTIIIPVAKEENCQKSISAIKKLNYDLNKIEVIFIKGNHPAKQRNIASEQAKGEIIYFLDNDSQPDKNNLNILYKFFQEHKNALIAGGPSLVKEDDTLFQKTIGCALGSIWGSAVSRSRYAQIGKLRLSSESELILCNMAMKKKYFMKMHQFNTNLYPNEENEFVNRLQRQYVDSVYYIPDLVVFRGHRKKLQHFIKQIFTYGRGRAEQVYVNIKDLTLFPLISLGFSIYLLSLFFIPYSIKFIPLIGYLLLIFLISFWKALLNGNFFYIFFLPLNYLIIHIFYGIGFFKGILNFIFKFKREEKKFWYSIQCQQKF